MRMRNDILTQIWNWISTSYWMVNAVHMWLITFSGWSMNILKHHNLLTIRCTKLTTILNVIIIIVFMCTNITYTYILLTI